MDYHQSVCHDQIKEKRTFVVFKDKIWCF